MKIYEDLKESFLDDFKALIHHRLLFIFELEIGYDTDFNPIIVFSEHTKKILPYFTEEKYFINDTLMFISPEYKESINNLKMLKKNLIFNPLFNSDYDNIMYFYELEETVLELMNLLLIISMSQNSEIDFIEDEQGFIKGIRGRNIFLNMLSDIEKKVLFTNFNSFILFNKVMQLSSVYCFLSRKEPTFENIPVKTNPHIVYNCSNFLN